MDESESSVDDEFGDKSYAPTRADEKIEKNDQQDEIDFNEESERSAKKRKKQKSKSQPKSKKLKKNEEFEEKKNVALEVAKYNDLFDVADPGYCDKALEKATWKKVAELTDLSVETCKDHWVSLKRSANYYVNEPREPYKSGAAADDEEVQKKYKDKWQFADIMSFYTPPVLKASGSLVSICNLPGSSSKKDISDIDSISNASTAGTSTTTCDTKSVYVSILKLFSLLFCIYLVVYFILKFTFIFYFRRAHR